MDLSRMSRMFMANLPGTPLPVEFAEQPVFQIGFPRAKGRDAPALRAVPKTAAQDIAAQPAERRVKHRRKIICGLAGFKFFLRPQFCVMFAARAMVGGVAKGIMMDFAVQRN